MALEPLATVASLSGIGAVFPDEPATLGQIAAASAAIREAAGQVIAPPTTIDLPLTGTRERWLTLPVSPVREVAKVQIDGIEAGDWRLRSGRLWRARGWWTHDGPAEVVVTLTYGLDECPIDLLPLIASLVAGQKAAVEEGYDPKRSLAYERIDDYQYGLRQGGDEVLSPVELTARTTAMLARRFGGGTYVTGSY